MAHGAISGVAIRDACAENAAEGEGYGCGLRARSSRTKCYKGSSQVNCVSDSVVSDRVLSNVKIGEYTLLTRVPLLT